MSVSKELPEGREAVGSGFRRADGQCSIAKTVSLGADAAVRWIAYGRFCLGYYSTPKRAMTALDREYPMEKQHGEK